MNRLWHLTVTAAFTIAPIIADCVALIPLRETGSLKVIALGIAGQELSAKIELYAEGVRLEAPLDHIPYGTYEMRVQARGFREARHEVIIDQPRTFLRVPVHLDGECGSPKAAALAGQVTGDLPPDLWIKAIPLRGLGEVVESKVESKGSFELRGLEYGEHILILTSGSKIVHQSVHSVSWNSKPLSIALASALQ